MTLHIYKSYVLCCDICGSNFDLSGKEKFEYNPRLEASADGWINGIGRNARKLKHGSAEAAQDKCSDCVKFDKEQEKKDTELENGYFKA